MKYENKPKKLSAFYKTWDISLNKVPAFYEIWNIILLYHFILK